mmetsp:Transcript_15779/g.28692  ORF Transcript_15779/g.28692 Transcript_15779/m.28692 type:complete len:249 (+) Transcript_15779:3128-3874(+)
MIETCRKCADIFPLVERTLASDCNFLELVLDQSQNADVLQFLSHETQQLRQDLGIKGIPCFSRDRKERATYCTAEAMCPLFGDDCNFAMTWAKAGHDFNSHACDRCWLEEDSSTTCLASAIHGESFWSVGPQFQDDSPFMLKVLEHHLERYSEVKGEAKADHVVMTTAFASLLVAGHRMTELHLKGQEHEIKDYLLFLRYQLVPFETFSVYILGNMPSTQSVKDTGTNLALLNQGIETSNIYKKLLTD